MSSKPLTPAEIEEERPDGLLDYVKELAPAPQRLAKYALALEAQGRQAQERERVLEKIVEAAWVFKLADDEAERLSALVSYDEDAEKIWEKARKGFFDVLAALHTTPSEEKP